MTRILQDMIAGLDEVHSYLAGDATGFKVNVPATSGNEETASQDQLCSQSDSEIAKAELLAAIHRAQVSITRGEGREITEQSMLEFVEDVKRRGRSRLVGE
jgi:hypothetical protein